MAAPKAAKIPPLIYGTAWKKDKTRTLVRQALRAGFLAIDTAAQPKHYREDLVGQAIRDEMSGGAIKREDLYIQTKFTAVPGQDPRNMPYDPNAALQDQIAASVASSLQNLRTKDNPSDSSDSTEPEYLDCLLLHSPLPTLPLTLNAWACLESHVPHATRTLGISNCYQLPLLRALWDSATIKPSVVQNRFYAETGYDAEIRAFCVEKGVRYQSFWTLTANPALLASRVVGEVAEKAAVRRGLEVSREAALYALVLGLGGTSVLDGTTNWVTMVDDLVGVEDVQAWAEATPGEWTDVLAAFKGLLNG